MGTDPLTILSLVEQTKNILKSVRDYVHDIRHCPEVITRIHGQVSTWNLQLESLRLIEEHGELQGNAKEVLQSKNVLGEADECLGRLKKLVDNAPRPARQQSGLPLQAKELWKRAIWPATTKDKANELLERLEVQRREIQLALDTSNS